MIRRVVVSFIFASTVIAAPVSGATLSDDVLSKRTEPDAMVDPGDLNLFDPGTLEAMQAARGDFDRATDIIERELESRADYASILSLAPQIRAYGSTDPRVFWLQALALAATGSLEEADKTLELGTEAAAQTDSPLPLLAEAMLQFRRGQATSAADLVREALQRAPDHAYAHNLMGIISADLGDAETAEANFARATELAPGAAVFWRNLGITRFGRDRIQTAAEALEKALDIAPRDCIALTASAQVYEAAQQPARAEELVRRCLDAETGDKGLAASFLLRLEVAQNRFEAARDTVDAYSDDLPAPDLLRAELSLYLGEPDRALREIAAASPGPATELRRWLALAMAGDTAAALKAVRAARAAGDDGAAAAFLDVALSAARGEPLDAEALTIARTDSELAAALAWFEALAAASTEGAVAAAKIAPAADRMMAGVRFIGVPEADWTTLAEAAVREPAALGMIWLLRGFTVPASTAFERVLSEATVHQARYFQALAEVQLDRHRAAMEILAPTASHLPDYFSAQILMGELHLRFGEMEAALASYTNAANAVPDGGVLMRIGLLADMLDKPDIAESALRQFIKLFPDSMIGYNQLAWVFIQREIRLDEALELAQRADELQPGNASVLDNIGWIMFLKGDTNAALDHLREANRRSGKLNPDILFHLAVVEAESGELDTSRKLLDRLFEVAPEDHAAFRKGRELRAQIE